MRRTQKDLNKMFNAFSEVKSSFENAVLQKLGSTEMGSILGCLVACLFVSLALSLSLSRSLSLFSLSNYSFN